MFVTLGGAQHERLQPRVQNVRRDGVDQLHFEEFGRLDLVHAEAPAVDPAQIDLLPVLVVAVDREQCLTVAEIFIEIASLRERRAV